MQDTRVLLSAYTKEVNSICQKGDFTEHSFRTSLENLLKGLFPAGLSVIQEPSLNTPGTPDFVIKQGFFPLGFVECKAIEKPLAVLFENPSIKQQLAKYRAGTDNLIFTNYREFWLFQADQQNPVITVDLGPAGNLSASRANAQALEQMIQQFAVFKARAATTPEELAGFLARRAKVLRDQTLARLERDIPKGQGPIVPYYHAFTEYLIPDMTPKQFADAYAQTIAYGLFMARASFDGTDFNRKKARDLLPATFHLIKTLFEHISGDLPPDLEWIIDSMALSLDRADLRGILSSFRRHGTEHDPFMHFYETFLAAFDPGLRERRGVYFTPRPVVSFITNSVNHILKTRFAKTKGLAEPGITLLDPALGTGTFLEMCMRLAKDEAVSAGLSGMFPNLVREHLLKNFYGFELLVAPYTIAHMKLAMTLSELGYQMGPDDRLRVYLTNTLDPQEIEPALFPLLKDLSDESRAANKVKRDTPILAILGNPPYSGHSANKGKWITELINDYKTINGRSIKERNIKWLQDDYVKFIRFGQWKIDSAGQGILGFITNHGYLDNPTFRGMRQSLLNSFSEIYLLNLHGSALKKETCPDRSKDENVFDIRQGVAIGIFVRQKHKPGPARVYYADLWGTRQLKYKTLGSSSVETVQWQELKPHSPYYFFVPRDEALAQEYEKAWSVKDIFPEGGVGITTARDKFVIDTEKERLIERILLFKKSDLPDEGLHERFQIAHKKGWDIRKAWKVLQKMKEESIENHVKSVLYRPFDTRYIFYHDSLVWRTVKKVMRHMLAGENIGLIVSRSVLSQEPWRDALVSDKIVEFGILATRPGNAAPLFPLYLYFDEEGRRLPEDQRTVNINPDFLELVAERTGRQRSAEAVFYYIYGVLYTPTYRQRYAEFLKYDFPRVPVFEGDVFEAISALGAGLVELHLGKRRLKPTVKYPVAGQDIVRVVRYNEAEKRVWINDTQFFDRVEPEAWNYRIGGYQVLDKWLKERKKWAKALTPEMVEHFQQVHEILLKTIDLQEQLDRAWPG